MSQGYVKDFVCNMPLKGNYLGGGDHPLLASGGITVHYCGAVAGHAKSLRLPDDVKAGLHGAHPV